ncbi:MAG: IPT/TIG domain-containing protein, partial [Acidimicrobiales bacterium]
MQGSRSRWVSKAATKALVASLVAVAGIGIIAVPEAFAATPTVTSVSPTSGTMNGGTTVTVNGSGFGTTASPSVTAVHFVYPDLMTPAGTAQFSAGTSIAVVKGSQLTVVSPKYNGSPTGTTVDIVVFDGTNQSTTSAADHYTFTPVTPTVTGVTTVATPPGGPTGGGTVVNVTGTNLAGVTAVHFGSTAGTAILENSLDSLSVTSPAGSAGTVGITVTNSAGTSATSSADQFTYNSALAMAPGTGAYGTGSSTSTGTTAQPPNDVFNVLSLMTGGPAADPTTLTVVSQPASGTITFNSNFLVYTPEQTDGGSSGAWTYDVTTTGTQTGSISICETASPSTCTTATMTFLQTDSGVYYMGGIVSTFGLMVGVSEDTGNGISQSATTGPVGSSFTV